MTRETDVAIIGAGPYGLGLAAHLRQRRIGYRIFGDPMRFWRDMPDGVFLKSLAFATNIAVPNRGYTFPQWCLEHGLEDFEPCTMRSFAEYGCEMQKHFVPDLEEVFVTNVSTAGRGFEITLASGERFHSRRVVSCTGLSGLAFVPPALRDLGLDRMRHTAAISDYSQFRGKTVAVIGAGASAIEAGALVREAGGSSEVFVRGTQAVFHGRTPRNRPLWRRLRDPMSVLGPSRRGWILQHFPLLVHRLPVERRTRFAKGQYGPASPWWIIDRVQKKVPINVRHELMGASPSGAGVSLEFEDAVGGRMVRNFDFVIAGTGYDISVRRLTYLDPALVPNIRCIENAPALDSRFESSVRGLHFLGPMSFMCFGPLFRFVAGAEVAAPRLARQFS